MSRHLEKSPIALTYSRIFEIQGPKVQQLLPTMQLDFLRKFLLPKTVHTLQCTRLPVDEADIASVRLRDMVKETIGICRTVLKALIHLKPKQGGLSIACISFDFEAALIIGLARMLCIPAKNMGPQHALTEVTTALVREKIQAL